MMYTSERDKNWSNRLKIIYIFTDFSPFYIIIYSIKYVNKYNWVAAMLPGFYNIEYNQWS